MPTDKGMRHSVDHERTARVEGDGERKGFHFVSLLLLASYTDATFCSTLLSTIKAFFLPKSEK